METKKENFILEAAKVTPSERQKAWQELEFYAFVHFGVNTFTDREWGTGEESPEIFNPSAFNADQWVEACKAAGMGGLILTCKHHDGFCLFQSELTEHSVKKSPWKDGKGDVVREVSDACRKGGIKFGIYLSPWDRHDARYGDSPAYNSYFIGQLEELLTQYGDIFSVWFDGACGEGSNGKRQVYDWDEYYKTIRQFQPNAVISVCGPDVRWCGNEAGHCRMSEWSVVPTNLRDIEKIEEKSQKIDDGEFSRRITSSDENLGSREIICHAEKLAWYPAEVNTSIRPGWFYHESEDSRVKSLDELMNIYYSSVGGNASFLLNIPPDKRGLFHEADAARLGEIGNTIRSAFAENLALDSEICASESSDDFHLPKNIIDGVKDSYWQPCEGTEQAELIVKFNSVKSFSKVVLMENISSGQRIEEFSLEYLCGEEKDSSSNWKTFFKGTVVGYKKICRFDKISATAIKLKIEQSRWQPTLLSVGVFE